MIDPLDEIDELLNARQSFEQRKALLDEYKRLLKLRGMPEAPPSEPAIDPSMLPSKGLPQKPEIDPRLLPKTMSPAGPEIFPVEPTDFSKLPPPPVKVEAPIPVPAQGFKPGEIPIREVGQRGEPITPEPGGKVSFPKIIPSAIEAGMPEGMEVTAPTGRTIAAGVAAVAPYAAKIAGPLAAFLYPTTTAAAEGPVVGASSEFGVKEQRIASDILKYKGYFNKRIKEGAPEEQAKKETEFLVNQQYNNVYNEKFKTRFEGQGGEQSRRYLEGNYLPKEEDRRNKLENAHKEAAKLLANEDMKTQGYLEPPELMKRIFASPEEQKIFNKQLAVSAVTKPSADVPEKQKPLAEQEGEISRILGRTKDELKVDELLKEKVATPTTPEEQTVYNDSKDQAKETLKAQTPDIFQLPNVSSTGKPIYDSKVEPYTFHNTGVVAPNKDPKEAGKYDALLDALMVSYLKERTSKDIDLPGVPDDAKKRLEEAQQEKHSAMATATVLNGLVKMAGSLGVVLGSLGIDAPWGPKQAGYGLSITKTEDNPFNWLIKSAEANYQDAKEMIDADKIDPNSALSTNLRTQIKAMYPDIPVNDKLTYNQLKDVLPKIAEEWKNRELMKKALLTAKVKGSVTEDRQQIQKDRMVRDFGNKMVSSLASSRTSMGVSENMLNRVRSIRALLDNVPGHLKDKLTRKEPLTQQEKDQITDYWDKHIPKPVAFETALSITALIGRNNSPALASIKEFAPGSSFKQMGNTFFEFITGSPVEKSQLGGYLRMYHDILEREEVVAQKHIESAKRDIIAANIGIRKYNPQYFDSIVQNSGLNFYDVMPNETPSIPASDTNPFWDVKGIPRQVDIDRKNEVENDLKDVSKLSTQIRTDKASQGVVVSLEESMNLAREMVNKKRQITAMGEQLIQENPKLTPDQAAAQARKILDKTDVSEMSDEEAKQYRLRNKPQEQ